jgi:hypothetical protein
MQIFKLLVFTIVVIAAITFLPDKAYGHNPIFHQNDNKSFETAQKIPDVLISRAIYGELGKDEKHFYKFSIDEAIDFYGEMTVPGNDRDYDPSFTIISKSIEERQDDITLDIPEDYGIIVFHKDARKESFFEPFTQTRYVRKQEVRRALTPGEYYLVVFHWEGKPGRYSLAVGEEEQWGAHDILRLPSIWYRVNQWYNPSRTRIIISAIIITNFASLLIIRRMLRN